jgi:hypothetical protein
LLLSQGVFTAGEADNLIGLSHLDVVGFSIRNIVAGWLFKERGKSYQLLMAA